MGECTGNAKPPRRRRWCEPRTRVASPAATGPGRCLHTTRATDGGTAGCNEFLFYRGNKGSRKYFDGAVILGRQNKPGLTAVLYSTYNNIVHRNVILKDPEIGCELRLTSVRVSLGSVSILQTVCPGALVLGGGGGGLPHSVPSLESLGPLAPVQPPPAGFHAQAVSLPILPVTFEETPAEK